MYRTLHAYSTDFHLYMYAIESIFLHTAHVRKAFSRRFQRRAPLKLVNNNSISRDYRQHTTYRYKILDKRGTIRRIMNQPNMAFLFSVIFTIRLNCPELVAIMQTMRCA